MVLHWNHWTAPFQFELRGPSKLQSMKQPNFLSSYSHEVKQKQKQSTLLLMHRTPPPPTPFLFLSQAFCPTASEGHWWHSASSLWLSFILVPSGLATSLHVCLGTLPFVYVGLPLPLPLRLRGWEGANNSQQEDRLVGLVVRCPPRERKVPGSNPTCAGIFPRSSGYPARRLAL